MTDQDRQPDEPAPEPRERPRDGATIIRARMGRLNLETCPQLLVEYAGMYKLDAAMVCAQGDGILADNIPWTGATALVEALRAQGEPCFAVPTADVVPVPWAKPIHGARMTPEDLGPVDAMGNRESAPWAQAIVLAMADVGVETSRPKRAGTDSVLTARLPAASLMCPGAVAVASAAAMAAGAGRQTTRKTETHTFLDLVFLGRLRRYRVDGRQFDYSLLGDQLQNSSEANLRLLTQRFLEAAPQVRTNLDRAQLDPVGRPAWPQLSLLDFNQLVQWLINLVRFRKEAAAAEA